MYGSETDRLIGRRVRETKKGKDIYNERGNIGRARKSEEQEEGEKMVSKGSKMYLTRIM